MLLFHERILKVEVLLRKGYFFGVREKNVKVVDKNVVIL